MGMIRANKITITLFLIACISIVVSDIWEKRRWVNEQDRRPRPSLDSLSKVMNSIPLADQFVSFDSFDREASVGVSATLKSNMTSNEVMTMYKDRLPGQGWKLDQEIFDPYISAKYCKQGEALVIQPSVTDKGTSTHIGLTWTYYSKASSFCDADPNVGDERP